MGLFGLIYNLIHRSIIATILLLLVLPYLPINLFPDFPLDPVSYEVPKSDEFFSKIKWNTLISDKAERILEHNIFGPESLVIKGDRLYTGLGDGRVVEINKNDLQNLKTVATLHTRGESQCGPNKIHNVTVCGRPLGIKFADSGVMYLVDASKGLFSVEFDPSVQVKHIALGPDAKGDSKLVGIFNDLALDPTNPDRVFVSVTSRKWKMDQILWTLVDMQNDGMIVSVDLRTGKWHTILDNLIFPNGLEISPNKRSLLVSLTGEYKIIKLDLSDVDNAIKNGKTVQKVTSLIENLPGFPDNIRLFGNDLYVGIPIINLNSTIADRLSKLPAVRKSLGRFANLISRFLWQVDQFYQCSCLRELAQKFHTGHILHSVLPNHSAVLIVDGNTGKTRRILGAAGFPAISEALLDISGDLYLGSYKNDYLGRISARNLK